MPGRWIVAAIMLAASPLAAQDVEAPAPEAWTPYLSMTRPAPGASSCPDGLCGGEALAVVFQRLSELDAGTRTAPVRILQIGDSHTAGDRITGALRARLQARHGRAGRGVLAPVANGSAFQVQVAGRGWRLDAAPLQTAQGRPTPRVGLSGRRAIGSAADGAELTLTTEPGDAVDHIGVCARPVNAQATLAIIADGAARTLSFEDGGEVCRSVVLDHRADTVRIALSDGVLALDSLWVEQATPGVVVSSLGVTGSSLRDLAARDETVIAAELAAWAPDLIVLAYGVNEGFEDGLDAAAYETLLHDQIARLRRLAPQTALMILGAPDGLRRGVFPACPRAADGGAPERGPPASLAVVRDVQRRVSDELGVAFWDWHGRMGGDCAAEGLATGAAPLMRPDRVHFTDEGAEWIGGVLADDLAAAHDAWRRNAPDGDRP